MGDRLGLPGAVYTRTCMQRCRVVGLREPRKSDGSAVYLPGDLVGIWIITNLAKLLSMFGALCALESIEIRRNINMLYTQYDDLKYKAEDFVTIAKTRWLDSPFNSIFSLNISQWELGICAVSLSGPFSDLYWQPLSPYFGVYLIGRINNLTPPCRHDQITLNIRAWICAAEEASKVLRPGQNTRSCTDVVLILGQTLRCWPTIKTTLNKCSGFLAQKHKLLTNVGLMLRQCHRRWAGIEPILD